ncbi:MAG: DUF4198 domain-containing protein [Fretibacterium sp.]|nr:DUF4198 domain-containing protein [Fretibacterium sp.]
MSFRQTRRLAILELLALALPASAHELTIKAKSTEVKAGVPFEATVQSAHRFIVPEEVEVLSRVKAGLFADGKFQESRISGNEKELCIDFSVIPPTDGTLLLVAVKDGESWCVTNEGGKAGARKELEAQGLKVLSANKYDKYAKAILNASRDDRTFATVIGHPLEVIPLTNPADAKVGAFFDVRILLNGQPYTGPVWATYDGFVTEYENTYAYYTEAESGVAHIKITAPGLWGVRAAQGGLPGVEGDYDALNLRAFLLFEVR